MLIKRNKKLLLIFLSLILGGCATTNFDSACHELSVKNKSALSKMVRGASKARFERHVVLLETGSALNSTCKSYYINLNDFENLPDSMRSNCNSQGVSGNERYCMLYSLDGVVVKQDVN